MGARNAQPDRAVYIAELDDQPSWLVAFTVSDLALESGGVEQYLASG